MSQIQIRTVCLLIIYLVLNSLIASAQAPESYIIALWSFDQSRRFRAERPYNADLNSQAAPATLTLYGQTIQEDGRRGVPYVDNTCGIAFEPTNAIRWDNIAGEDVDNRDDDAYFEVSVSTVDWQNLAFRFFYRSDRADSFDLSYHLGDGRWQMLADDVVISDTDEWSNIEVGLQDVKDIENRATIVFRVNDLTRNNRDDKFFIDNVALVGQRISTDLDCPPILDPITPLEDIAVFLNSSTIPTFTGDQGFQFIVTDDNSPFSELTVLATTSDPNVINQLGLIPIDTENGIFQLEIGTPHGFAGVAEVCVHVTDGSGNTVTRSLQYAASDAPMDDTTTYHQGTAYASAVVALDETYMAVANENNQQINIYPRTESGMPIATFDVSDLLALPSQNENGVYATVDIESATQIGNVQIWLGSHSAVNGQPRLNRYRLFATQSNGQGADTQLSFLGYYDGLLDSINGWGIEQGFDFTTLNIEGVSIAPDGQTAYMGLRTPAVSENRALIIPIQDFATWFNNGSPSNPPTLGNPIELDLGGFGIRGMECNRNGCVIIAGAMDNDEAVVIYTWSGNPNEAPSLRAVDLTDMQPESVIIGDDVNFTSGRSIQLLSNNDNTDWYQTGENTASLSPNLQVFRSDFVIIE